MLGQTSLVQLSDNMDEMPIYLPNGYEINRASDKGGGKGPNVCLQLRQSSEKEEKFSTTYFKKCSDS